jgi:RNA polymerase sigma-70 factor (ECF subfamily)
LLRESLKGTAGIADLYQLQAAMAAQHAVAPTAAGTDWAELVRLYDLLLGIQPGNRAAALGRAVAMAEARGPAAGLGALDRLPDRDHRWHAVRAELLGRLHRFGEAIEEMRASLTGTLPAPERAHRERRVSLWSQAPP